MKHKQINDMATAYVEDYVDRFKHVAGQAYMDGFNAAMQHLAHIPWHEIFDEISEYIKERETKA